VTEMLVRTLATGLYRAGLTGALSATSGYLRRAAAFSVFTYHRVNDHGDPFFEALPTEVFERQMQLIARHYVVLPVEELVARLRSGTVPRNAVAITFDDGYRDVLTHAAPILARYHLPATVFLATGFIGSGEVPWYDRLATALKSTAASQVAVPASDEVLPLETREARLLALGRLQAHWKGLPEADSRRALETLLERLGTGQHDRERNAFLRWDEVHALRGLGFRIGAHTVSHPILSRLPADRACAEIVESKRAIEARCGISPRAFAYPNGGEADYTPAVVDQVRRAGFDCAVTTRFGLNTARTSPWELRRGQPWEHHLPTFATKLAWYRMTLS
jgi:peptidoglycan/xylan/chitin deacetylase (PgdA/CDA1 family)